jgi:hypothetical protein
MERRGSKTNACTWSWDYTSFNERSGKGFVGERVNQRNLTDLVRELDAGKPHVQFDERDVKTE